MSEAISHVEARHAAVEHHDVGFIRHYIFSTDHKMIGKQFLTLGLFGLMMGGILALLVRWELAWPETPVPGMGWVPEPTMYGDRKSTRLNSSHLVISYAVFCLKKKKKI